MNINELKNLIIEAESKEAILSIFENLGFEVEEGDDTLYVEITDEKVFHIVFYSDIRELEKKAKSVGYGKYFTLGISEDFEEWIFAKRIVEDGVRLKKYKFSKEKLNESPKPLPVQKILSLKQGDIKSFDAIFERKDVTKKFYTEFKKLIEGLKTKINIKDEKDRHWYASVLVNRILFIYFIQHKELLGDRETRYLSKKLKTFAKKKKNTFFKEFLFPLFFDGFAKREKDRSNDVKEKLGIVPYLNGGLFQKHVLEIKYPDIQIPDLSFSKIFDYLDSWNWHLDDKKDTEEGEISPEVLGYIFEKLINQKQMGAYYTKEDITGYISKNTIIPRLFDMVKEKCPKEFSGKNSIFQTLFQNPDEYFYDAVLKGYYVDNEKKTIRELPKQIAVGINDVLKRNEWNKHADEQYALPTEIWREVVSRRQRYEEIRDRLNKGKGAEDGEDFSINDLITYNLNIIQFTIDVIHREKDNSQLVKAFYESLKEITVLDPTCGSGAFLFAALNILEDIYEACLDKLPDERKKIAKRYQKNVGNHVKYHIYKTIILNNLFGVDIMEEAVEICKLRLFLKLIGQVEREDGLENLGIEPLPDIDFNIFAGNTLVGFTKKEEVETYFENAGMLNFFAGELERIQKQSDEIEVLHDSFLARQSESEIRRDALQSVPTTGVPTGTETLKQLLQKQYGELNEKLNQYLANIYGVDVKKQKQYEDWKESHKPFHWIVSFYPIMKKGGFDVIIGNPPYVEYSKVKKEYTVKGYETESCGNLYVYALELSNKILLQNGKIGIIVQLPIVCTDRMIPVQKLLMKKFSNLWFLNFDDRPGKLFDAIEHIRATILLTANNLNQQNVFSTNYTRWYSENRCNLFKIIELTSIKEFNFNGFLPKIGNNILKKIIVKIKKHEPINNVLDKNNNKPIYFHNAPQYWIRATSFKPYFYNEKDGERLSLQVKPISIKLDQNLINGIINSQLFYIWFILSSDCRHLNLREISNFPCNLKKFDKRNIVNISKAINSLMNDFQKHKIKKETFYKTTGKVIYDEYYPKYSKPIIDEIDRVLAEHYGFTEEELDYIINYDIKYRMGKSLEQDASAMLSTSAHE